MFFALKKWNGFVVCAFLLNQNDPCQKQGSSNLYYRLFINRIRQWSFGNDTKKIISVAVLTDNITDNVVLLIL